MALSGTAPCALVPGARSRGGKFEGWPRKLGQRGPTARLLSSEAGADMLPIMPIRVRAIRGATTVDSDTREDVTLCVQELMLRLIDDNELAHDDLISVIFTATEDIVSMFPATAARELGLGDVPLLCARELSVEGAAPRCIRVLMHVNTERSVSQLRHVYLKGARSLRDDLPG